MRMRRSEFYEWTKCKESFIIETFICIYLHNKNIKHNSGRSRQVHVLSKQMPQVGYHSIPHSTKEKLVFIWGRSEGYNRRNTTIGIILDQGHMFLGL